MPGTPAAAEMRPRSGVVTAALRWSPGPAAVSLSGEAAGSYSSSSWAGSQDLRAPGARRSPAGSRTC